MEQQHPVSCNDGDEINLLDYAKVLWAKKKLITIIVFFITAAAIGISLILPITYQSEGTVMPLGGAKGGGLAAVAMQMGLGDAVGGIAGGSTPTAQCLALLKSRTLSEKIIDRFHLMQVFFKKLWDPEHQIWKVSDAKKIPAVEDGVKKLRKFVAIQDDKKASLIKITGEFKDPQLAADIVNGYIQALGEQLKQNTFTTAKRNRIFIEGQFENNKVELLEAGKELAAFYSKNNVSNVVPNVDVDVSVLTSGDSAPKLDSADENKFEELSKKTEELQKQSQELHEKIVKGVPQQVYLQYLTLQRELLTKVNALLTQQYEMAKIDEAKEDVNFQVIDWARVPVRKFKPKRAQIVLVAFFFSIFLSVFIVLFQDYLKKMKDPEKLA